MNPLRSIRTRLERLLEVRVRPENDIGAQLNKPPCDPHLERGRPPLKLVAPVRGGGAEGAAGGAHGAERLGRLAGGRVGWRGVGRASFSGEETAGLRALR